MVGRREGILVFEVKGEGLVNDRLWGSLDWLKGLRVVREDDDIFIGSKGKVYMY